MNIISTEMRNTRATNVSLNCDSEKVRYKIDYYFLHTVLLVIILLLAIANICYYYSKRRSKLKSILSCQQYNKENDEFKKGNLKNLSYYYFDDITKSEEIDLDNVLTDKKSRENILIDDISYKNFIGLKTLRIRFDKKDGFIRIYDGTMIELQLNCDGTMMEL